MMGADKMQYEQNIIGNIDRNRCFNAYFTPSGDFCLSSVLFESCRDEMGFQEARAAMFRSLRDVWSADSQNRGQGKVQYWTEMSV